MNTNGEYNNDFEFDNPVNIVAMKKKNSDDNNETSNPRDDCCMSFQAILF